MLPAHAGCQRESNLVPVSGVVTLQGKPLTHGSISFRPDAQRGNNSQEHPTGVIHADGRYELFVRQTPGAPPGWYRVIVFANEQIPESVRRTHPRMPNSLIDRRYNSPQRTPLSVEVRGDAPPTTYHFNLRATP